MHSFFPGHLAGLSGAPFTALAGQWLERLAREPLPDRRIAELQVDGRRVTPLTIAGGRHQAEEPFVGPPNPAVQLAPAPLEPFDLSSFYPPSEMLMAALDMGFPNDTDLNIAELTGGKSSPSAPLVTT